MTRIPGQTKPAVNEFARFIDEYHLRCAERFPALEATAAKWHFEDMIPGLSDVDTRLIVANGTGPEDYIKLDEVVGDVHDALCRECPRWSRLLEHTPGIAITWDELYDPRLYNPETRLWSGYLGKTREFDEFRAHLDALPWRDADEHFVLNKFCYYFSPYQRGIDPPINLGIFEPEYAWHSRAMHYFTPAAQAGLSVIERRAVRGKFECLRRWKEVLPAETIFDEIMEMTANQYARMSADDAALGSFEGRLFDILCRMKQLVFEATTICPVEPDEDISALRAQLKGFPANPLMLIFNGVRFSRIRKSRYLFYLHAPEYFDTEWLIENEFVKWNREVLMKGILGSYGKLRCGKSDAGIDEIIEAIHPALIDREQADIVRKMHELSFDRYVPGSERELIREMVPCWCDYYRVLELILADAKTNF